MAKAVSSASLTSDAGFTDEEVEEELQALEERELLMYLAGKWEEERAVEALESLKSSTGWVSKVESVWRFVVGVMERFRSNLDVQRLGCDVIRRCAWLIDDEGRAQMVNGAASRAVATAMSKYSDSLVLQHSACCAIASMARKNGKTNRVLVETLFASLVIALNNFVDDREIRVESTRAISSVCESKEKQVLEKVVQLGTLEALKSALQVENVTPEIVIQSCSALSSISSVLGEKVLLDHGIAEAILKPSISMFEKGEYVASSRCMAIASTCLAESDLLPAVYVALYIGRKPPMDIAFLGALFALVGAVAGKWSLAALNDRTVSDFSNRSEKIADSLRVDEDLEIIEDETDNQEEEQAMAFHLEIRLNNLVLYCIHTMEKDPQFCVVACSVLATLASKWRSRSSLHLASHTTDWVTRCLQEYHLDWRCAEAACRAIWAFCGTVGGQQKVADTDIASTVALVANSSSRQPRALTAALFATSRLGYQQKARKIFVQQKVPEAAEHVLTLYQVNSEVVTASLSCLETLLPESQQDRADMLSRGLLSLVLTALDEWLEVESAVVSALGTLRVLAMDGGCPEDALKDKNVEEKIFKAMSAYPWSRSVQLKACSATTNLTFQNQPLKMLMVAQGVLDLVLEALRTWIADENLVYSAMCAICSLTLRVESARDGGMPLEILGERIFDVMSKYRESSSIMALCCRAVSNLCRGSEDIQDYFLAEQCHYMILEAMQEFLHESDLQIDGCGAICLLADEQEEIQLQIGHEGVRVIINAMRVHPENLAVQKSALAALCILSQPDELARACIQEDVLRLTAKALELDEKDKILKSYAAKVYSRLKRCINKPAEGSDSESDDDSGSCEGRSVDLPIQQEASVKSNPADSTAQDAPTQTVTKKVLRSFVHLPATTASGGGFLRGVLERRGLLSTPKFHATGVSKDETTETEKAPSNTGASRSQTETSSAAMSTASSPSPAEQGDS